MNNQGAAMNDITDPAVRKVTMRARILDLQIEILHKLDQIAIMEHELK